MPTSRNKTRDNNKRVQGMEGETPYPNPGNCCADREWKTEEKKKKNREWVPNPAALDHLVTSYTPHEL